jgi:hypothetical protein
MTHSEQIDALAAALADARPTFKPVIKDKTAKIRMKSGGEYSYKYADLSSVFEATTDELARVGLTLIQAPEMVNGEFVLTALLTHKSGQWLRTEYPLHRHETPQEQGSEITYARRYQATGVLSVAAEEDEDGVIAQEAVTTKQAEAPTTLKDLKVEPTQNPAVTRYVATFADGRKASTIKDDLGTALRTHAKIPAAERPSVFALIERGKYGMELLEMTLTPPSADQAF